ncbi:MAG: flagellar export chaperone FliS [bacterium]|nr:flagellar export chaperone FliS [bacterium]
MSGTPAKSYLRDAVMTASPEQLHLMLYDGAIKFALQGRDALVAKDYEESYTKLSRAQAIVLEMLNGLRSEVNPELCDRMSGVYNFLYRKLVDASVQKAPVCVDEAVKILRYQRETWVMLMEKVSSLRGGDDAVPLPDSPVGETVGGGLSVEG